MVRILKALLWIVCAWAFVGLGACEPNARDETDIFQEAEARYRGGDYDGATSLYNEFIAQYPQSPFTDTARLRLRTIDREVGAVMGARGGNRPIYIRPSAPGHTEMPERPSAKPNTPFSPTPFGRRGPAPPSRN